MSGGGSDRMILFGGVGIGGTVRRHLGLRRPHEHVDEPRSRHLTKREGLALHGLRRRDREIVLFSGGETRDTDLDDVWLFDPAADTWSQVA